MTNSTRLPPQDYSATAAFFERKAAKARTHHDREKFKAAAAEYRAKAVEQAEQRKRAYAASATPDQLHN
jgi:hypothetical protein